MEIHCDSHTSTHGAFGALAHGIGTSEVEHTMATQCITAKKSKSMLIEVSGRLKPGVTAKDIALYIIGQIGTAGGTILHFCKIILFYKFLFPFLTLRECNHQTRPS